MSCCTVLLPLNCSWVAGVLLLLTACIAVSTAPALVGAQMGVPCKAIGVGVQTQSICFVCDVSWSMSQAVCLFCKLVGRLLVGLSACFSAWMDSVSASAHSMFARSSAACKAAPVRACEHAVHGARGCPSCSTSGVDVSCIYLAQPQQHSPARISWLALIVCSLELCRFAVIASQAATCLLHPHTARKIYMPVILLDSAESSTSDQYDPSARWLVLDLPVDPSARRQPGDYVMLCFAGTTVTLKTLSGWCEADL